MDAKITKTDIAVYFTAQSHQDLLQALRDVTNELVVQRPPEDAVRRTAELSLEAARYFCPKLLSPGPAP